MNYTIPPKKMVIINILDILKRYTDENHKLSQKQIADILMLNQIMSSIDKKDPEIVRAIILDHYENPVNFIQDTKNVECYESYNSASPSCIDNLTAYVLVKDNKI